MHKESPIATITAMTARTLGVFRGQDAVRHGVSRKQIHTLCVHGFVRRVLPDTYCVAAVGRSAEQQLRAALAWAGPDAAGWCLSAGAIYRLEDVAATRAEIVVPGTMGCRPPNDIHVMRSDARDALMIRRVRGIPVTGIEATVMALAARLDEEALEVACEDARRRRLTSVPALRTYLARHAGHGRAGAGALRELLRELDPKHPSRSKLEVLTRRLLVAKGLGHFVRELPLQGRDRTYYFDFGFTLEHVIVEANGRKWHDDPNDYEYDNEKWSVPAQHGYRIVFATWRKVLERPDELCDEIRAAFAA